VVTGAVRTLRRLEGGAAFGRAVDFCCAQGGNAWVLVPLILAVDGSLVGYIANPRVGAAT
jgi:hypothetical protein